MKLNVMIGMLLAIFLVVCVSSALAVTGPQNVSNTVHNLSLTGVAPWGGAPGSSIYATNEDQICVFCHTPHGGSTTGPLWNRNDPESTFTHYNSGTLSTYLKGLPVGRPVEDESLICLSCHDGTISVNHMINLPNDVNSQTDIYTIFGGVTATDTKIAYVPGLGAGNLGTDLTDDHPISFSYDLVRGSSEYGAGGSKVGQLNTYNAAILAGVEFFGTDHRVECSSCHDPHVDYLADTNYRPFLITSNAGSGLCLACHTL